MIHKLVSSRKSTLKITDERIKLTTELITSIRILKYFTWEPLFLDKIHALRRKELDHIAASASIRGITQSLGFGIPAFASGLTFIIYAALNENPDPTLIFASMALFNQVIIVFECFDLTY
jgi:ATP-binding cassette, subfamily C (CFTR/MRP), member 1